MRNILTISDVDFNHFKTDTASKFKKNIEEIFTSPQQNELNNDDGNDRNPNDHHVNNDSTKSKLFHLIRRDISWGRNMEYFIVILRNSICRLSSQQPYITPMILFESFQQMVHNFLLIHHSSI